MIKAYYKIENGVAQTGSGEFIPDGCIEYTVGQEPQELKDALVKEELINVENTYKQKIQEHLDAEAKQKGYDNILSACSYASIANDFQAESQNFVVWRASVWSYGYAQLALIKSGGRTLPSVEEFIAELPKFER